MLVDINMPGMTGIEYVARIKQMEKDGILKLNRCAIAALTALPKESMPEYKALGFDYFIEKPLNRRNMARLLSKIRNIKSV